MNGSEWSLIVQTEGSDPRGSREEAYAWTLVRELFQVRKENEEIDP